MFFFLSPLSTSKLAWQSTLSPHPHLRALGAAEKRRRKEEGGRRKAGKETGGERLQRAGRGETRRETGREGGKGERGTECCVPAAAWI